MNINESVGWLATVLTMLSFLTHKMLLLRIINFSACVIWVFYGIFTGMMPVIVTNSLIAVIHLYWYAKTYHFSGKKQESNQ